MPILLGSEQLQEKKRKKRGEIKALNINQIFNIHFKLREKNKKQKKWMHIFLHLKNNNNNTNEEKAGKK